MRKFGAISTILILLFAGYVLIAPSPELRIARTCSPVSWFGNVVESIVLMVYPSAYKGVNQSFYKTTYGCQYTVWRLFYGQEYEQAIKNDADSTDKESGVDENQN